MSQHVFNNFDRLFLYIIIIYCVLTIKSNKISQNNNDIIYYYFKYSAEEIITRNNFRSIYAKVLDHKLAQNFNIK
jgi:hypothetical protein